MAILMTEQLAQQLIAHYEQSISEVKECINIYSVKELCIIKNISGGLCYCADKEFNVNVYGCNWLKRKANGKMYLTSRPSSCDTTQQIIDALQTRVDILKTFKAV